MARFGLVDNAKQRYPPATPSSRHVPNQQPPTHHHAHTPSLTSAGHDSLLRLTLPRTLDCSTTDGATLTTPMTNPHQQLAHTRGRTTTCRQTEGRLDGRRHHNCAHHQQFSTTTKTQEGGSRNVAGHSAQRQVDAVGDNFSPGAVSCLYQTCTRRSYTCWWLAPARLTSN
jgi:hypothetical protein